MPMAHAFNTPRPVRGETRADMVSVVDSIRSIIRALRIAGREAEQELGISSAQLFVLQELKDRPSQSINELAERTYTHQSSVSMVVARLVKNRLVRRATSRGDARRLSISITPAGRALLKRSPDAAQTRLIAGLKAMSRSRLKALSENLALLADLLEDKSSTSVRGRKEAGGRSGIALRA